MTTIAFIGLGVMGYPMAGHLAAAGHDVRVFNRTRAKADAWAVEHAGTVADTPAAAADGAEIVITIVGADDDVRAVTTGPGGALETMAAGATLVDHTTASADVARELHGVCAERGIGFVDAPVSGGEAGAQNGKLTIMCGGDESVFAAVEPVLDTYAVGVTLLGPAGAGQLTKMVNQVCIAGVLAGLAEGVHLAMAAGLDIAQVTETLSKGAAGSWQMANRAETMAAGEFDFGFAVDWFRKDLGIALDESKRLGTSMPNAAAVDQLYARIQARGGNRWDTSSLIDLLSNP